MGKVDPNADPTIIKRINDFQKMWMKLTRTAPTSPVAKSMSDASAVYWERVHRIGKIVEARAYDQNYFAKMITRTENSLREFFGKMTDLAPNTEKYERFMQRRAEGFVTEQLATLESAKAIDAAYKQLDGVFKEYGIGEQMQATLTWKSVEVGSEPWLIDYTIQTNPQAVRMLERNRDEFINLMDSLGIDKADQVKIIEAGKTVTQTYYEVLSVSSQIGADTSKLQGIGYMNRVFSREAGNVVDTIDNMGVRVRQKYTGDITSAFFQKSREFADFVPQDEAVMDYLFTRGKVYDRLNKELAKNPELAAKIGKTNVTQFSDMLVNGGEPVLLEAVINTLDEDELRFLVQNGFLSKIPWETGRVYEYLNDVYKFPFEGINEVFISDPRKAFQLYKNTLVNLASERGSVFGLIDGAINEFGIPKSMLDPVKHKGFVRLRDAFTDDVLQNVIGKSKEAMTHMDNVYIHPDVARVFRADMEIATSPYWLGIFSDLFNATKKWASGLVLGSSQWFGRQVVGNAGHLMSYGVSPFGYVNDVGRFIQGSIERVLKGESQFDMWKYLPDKKVFAGGTMSEKDLWRLGQQRGLLNDFTAFGKRTEITGSRGLRGMRRSMNEFLWVLKTYPEHFGRNAADRAVQYMSDNDNLLFRFIGWGNASTDNAMRYNMLKAVMSDNRLFHRLGMGGIDTVPYIKDPTEAIKWVEKHVYMFDEIPVDKDLLNVANSVVPFMNWRIKNMQQTVRFMTERPHLFGTYLELAKEPYDEFKHDDPLAWKAMTNGWVKESDFPVPWVIPSSKSASGNDEVFTFPLSNINPELGGVSEVANWLDILGLFTGERDPHERRGNPYAKNENLVLRTINEESSPLASIATSLLTGKDKFGNDLANLQRGVKHRTMFGVEVDPTLYYFATTVAPMIRNAEKTYSAVTGGAGLGGAPDLDVTTGDFRPYEETWTGARTDRMTPKQEPDWLPYRLAPIERLGDILGFSPIHVNHLVQMGYTQSDIEMQLREAKKRLNSFKYKLAIETDPEAQQKHIEEYEDLLMWAMLIESEWKIYEQWRKELGIPSSRALQIIKEQDMKVDEMLPDGEQQRIYREIYKKYNTEFLR
jgi:hypothetical protein